MMIWVLVAVLLFLAALAGLKLMAPHSRRLKRRTGAETREKPPGYVGDKSEAAIKYSKKYAWLPVVALALVILYYGVYTQAWRSPSPSEVGEVGATTWFWIACLWILVHVLVAMVASKESAKWLHKCVATVAIAMIAVFPAYRWASQAWSQLTIAAEVPSSSPREHTYRVPAHGSVVAPLPIGRSSRWNGAVDRYELVYRSDPRCEGGQCRIGVRFFNNSDSDVPVTVTPE